MLYVPSIINCNTTFPAREEKPSNIPRTGLAYTPLADNLLIGGMIVARMGDVAALILSITLTLKGFYFAGMVQAPLSLLMSLALYVVFQRSADLK
jgi:membrane protein implicated in regulation of membrane protease activity